MAQPAVKEHLTYYSEHKVRSLDFLFLLYQDKRKKYIKITKKAEVQNPRFFYPINLYDFLTFKATYFFVSVSSSFRFGSFLARRTILYT